MAAYTADCGLLLLHARPRRAELPDPGSDGQPPKTRAQHLGVGNSQYQAAQTACQHLLPTGGAFQQQASQCILADDCPPTLVQQMMTTDRKVAQSMRSPRSPNADAWSTPRSRSGSGRGREAGRCRAGAGRR